MEQLAAAASAHKRALAAMRAAKRGRRRPVVRRAWDTSNTAAAFRLRTGRPPHSPAPAAYLCRMCVQGGLPASDLDRLAEAQATQAWAVARAARLRAWSAAAVGGGGGSGDNGSSGGDNGSSGDEKAVAGELSKVLAALFAEAEAEAGGGGAAGGAAAEAVDEAYVRLLCLTVPPQAHKGATCARPHHTPWPLHTPALLGEPLPSP